MFCDTQEIPNQQLRTIKLTGILGRKFGRIHRLAVDSPAEAVRALCAIKAGFREFLERSHLDGFGYKVLIDKMAIDAENAQSDLHMHSNPASSFTFAPRLTGAKSVLGQIILGIALIAVSFIPGVAAIAWLAKGLVGFGMSLTLGGVTQMLAPKIKSGDPKESDKNKPSYIFNGAVNTVAQGQPVPILYGRMMVGSAVVSAGITSKDIPI